MSSDLNLRKRLYWELATKLFAEKHYPYDFEDEEAKTFAINCYKSAKIAVDTFFEEAEE